VIATHPERGSKRLGRRLAERFDGPILHVVVDSERELASAA
jgi:hypothetical protein